MACEGCERRRKEMALMLEAGKQWTRNPTGPSIHDVYMRLRNEAIARGEIEINASIEPRED
jgi:hypothetical protein